MRTFILAVLIVIFITFPSCSTFPTNTGLENALGVQTGNVLYVGGTGPGNYTRIQDAVNDSHNGDSVMVFDELSPYFETIIINSSISLIGEDKNTTVIDGRMQVVNYVLLLNAEDVFISGFTIQGCQMTVWPNSAIYALGNHSIVTNNIIRDCPVQAILSLHTSHHIVSNNLIDNCSQGIGFHFSSDNTIIHNHLINCAVYAMYLLSSRDTISDNTFDCCGQIVIGLALLTNISNNTFDLVSISLEQQSCYVYVHHNTFTNCSAPIVISRECRFNHIDSNLISACEYGIMVCYGRDNTISNNTIQDNDWIGIIFEYAHSNHIIDNYIARQECGISLQWSSDNLIENNIIEDNNRGSSQGYGGIEVLYSSYQNKIFNNTFRNNSIDASFALHSEYFWPHFYYEKPNLWEGNYWSRPRLFPKLISGYISTNLPLFFHHIKWINIDRHPAKKPYAIGV